jgi:hypothetical protein
LRAFLLALLVILSLAGTGCNESITMEPISKDQIRHAELYGLVPDYDRDKYFGGSWKNVRDRCDVREILIERASGHEAVDTDRDRCKDDGSFVDVFTGQIVTGKQAQVDHVYPVHKFWLAQGWLRSQSEREEFYQDQSNLVLTSLNQEKGDKGPDEWQPPFGKCEYARKYQFTVVKYSQPVTSSEDVALREMLETCPKG